LGCWLVLISFLRTASLPQCEPIRLPKSSGRHGVGALKCLFKAWLDEHEATDAAAALSMTEADIDPSVVQSNSFPQEWPPRSGQVRQFPEFDRAAQFDLADCPL
jgi:hypothetical protein